MALTPKPPRFPAAQGIRYTERKGWVSAKNGVRARRKSGNHGGMDTSAAISTHGIVNEASAIRSMVSLTGQFASLVLVTVCRLS
ncbi:hypothetical protein BJI47_18940 [Rhodococcus sp. 1168]|nr:hypothetical protein BJI47_18940 [Rhodococcus sp. 1168]